VSRLIDSDLTAARERYVSEHTPTQTKDRTAIDTAGPHCGDEGRHVVAHQIKLVNVVLVGWMNRDFGGRQSKDQPAPASVDVSQPQHIAKKGAVSIRVFAVNDRMGANDHFHSSFGISRLAPLCKNLSQAGTTARPRHSE
jgi:hypothetical protein